MSRIKALFQGGIFAPHYSTRNATAGSMRIARRVGSQHATNATAIKSVVTAA